MRFRVITQALTNFLTITFTSLVGGVGVSLEGILRGCQCNVFKHIGGVSVIFSNLNGG